jgi:murein DD-endopeptidase MepM/ murein hydrolase activator NlpD
MPRDVSFADVLGLRPLPLAIAQMRMTFAGDAFVPSSRFDRTSLRMLRPRLAFETWTGRVRADRLVPIFNLVNRTPTPVEEGWSVRKTQVRDFRGRGLSYDSHNGTDFCVPPGTVVVAAAPGRVLAVRREFHRGGLKVYVDHGDGLVTTYNHLSRALVAVGEDVARAQPIALSGASGIDSTLLFPWVAPHVHFNVWLDGAAVDPFAAPGEVALWRGGNRPVPSTGPAAEDGAPTIPYEPAAIEAVLAVCRDPRFVANARAISDVNERALHVLVETVTYPTRFSAPEAGRLLYAEARGTAPSEPRARSPRLDLPFDAKTFAGIWFPDEPR